MSVHLVVLRRPPPSGDYVYINPEFVAGVRAALFEDIDLDPRPLYYNFNECAVVELSGGGSFLVYGRPDAVANAIASSLDSEAHGRVRRLTEDLKG